jgi:hypothetical protein
MATSAEEPTRQPIVTKIDHILVELGTPETLFSFFTQEPQLPIAWPLTDYGAFRSGGVSCGNAVLEFVRFESQREASSEGARFAGIAFWPFESAEASVTELDQRSLRHDPPMPRRGVRDGEERLLWVNVRVTDLPPQDARLFISDYKIETKTRRAAASAELKRRQGGPLGLTAIKEVRIGVRNLEEARGKWRRFLDPSVEARSGIFPLAEGPAIKLVSSTVDAIEAITFQVASATQAAAFLKARSLLKEGENKAMLLAETRTQGVQIFVEE